MRPKPTVSDSHTNLATGALTEICSCEGVFFVTFKGTSITLRKSNSYYEKHFRYGKTSFTNKAHAFNLAESLNKLFKTNQFEVHELVDSQVAIEGEIDD